MTVSIAVDISKGMEFKLTDRYMFAKTPGKAAVFYDGEIVLGGGVII